MTKLMMEVFHLVKKASITRDLIVRQTHEAKRSNSERFKYYDTNTGAQAFCPVILMQQRNMSTSTCIGSRQGPCHVREACQVLTYDEVHWSSIILRIFVKSLKRGGREVNLLQRNLPAWRSRHGCTPEQDQVEQEQKELQELKEVQVQIDGSSPWQEVLDCARRREVPECERRDEDNLLSQEPPLVVLQII